MGERHPIAAKTLTGFGSASEIEVRESHEGNAYRAVYTVRYEDAGYVLHAFPEEIQEGYGNSEDRYGFDQTQVEGFDPGEGAMTKLSAAKDPSRNVWLQLGFPDAEEHYLKAELVLRLHKTITTLGITQRTAARRIGTTQPELSKILAGKFSEVSFERLMRFLAGLGHDIEITIGKPSAKEAGQVTVRDSRRRAA